jgi:hypothetical protein
MAKSLKRGKGSRKSLKRSKGAKKSLRRGKGFRKNVKIYGGGKTTRLHTLVNGLPGFVVGNFEEIRRLQIEGADVNAEDENNKTPLDIILSNNNDDIEKMSPVIIYLLQSGAEYNEYYIRENVKKYIDKMKDYLFELETGKNGKAYINRRKHIY